MEPRMIQLDGFNVMGISTRTTNEYEMKGNGNIPSLWTRFLNEEIRQQIPNAIDSNTVAVYIDYESDDTGAYTLVVGGKVPGTRSLPDDMVVKEVPAGKYFVFTSRKGPISQVTVETWIYIWEWFAQSELRRAYVADFELYDERSIDCDHAQIDIYIGVV